MTCTVCGQPIKKGERYFRKPSGKTKHRQCRSFAAYAGSPVRWKVIRFVREEYCVVATDKLSAVACALEKGGPVSVQIIGHEVHPCS